MLEHVEVLPTETRWVVLGDGNNMDMYSMVCHSLEVQQVCRQQSTYSRVFSPSPPLAGLLELGLQGAACSVCP